jgi:GDP-4-dehydro-6-deoxy-D-mannose reductase
MKHRYLITGVSGFVAGHFLNLLAQKQDCESVLGVDIQLAAAKPYPFPFQTQILNLLDSAAVEALLLEYRPTRILHLASFSNVGASWKAPAESFTNNTNIFLNLIEPLRRSGLSARVLSVGSSEEYGSVGLDELPLVETRPLSPESPYGVARVAQEQLSRVFAQGYGMDIIMTRSFNHIGPGQRDQFVVPSFVKQVALSALSKSRHCRVRTGNTKVIRDFLDVRDVVDAYWELFERGRSGEVYNVCSGTGRSLDQILEALGEIAGIDVSSETDASLIRPNELMAVVGSALKLKNETDWSAKISFEQSLKDLVAHWKEIVIMERTK